MRIIWNIPFYAETTKCRKNGFCVGMASLYINAENKMRMKSRILDNLLPFKYLCRIAAVFMFSHSSPPEPSENSVYTLILTLFFGKDNAEIH